MMINERASGSRSQVNKSREKKKDVMFPAEAEIDSTRHKSPEIEARVSDRETINDESDCLNACLCCCVIWGRLQLLGMSTLKSGKLKVLCPVTDE